MKPSAGVSRTGTGLCAAQEFSRWLPFRLGSAVACLSVVLFVSGCVSSVDTSALQIDAQETSTEQSVESSIDGETTELAASQFVPTRSPRANTPEQKVAAVVNSEPAVSQLQSASRTLTTPATENAAVSNGESTAVAAVEQTRPAKPSRKKVNVQPTEQELARAQSGSRSTSRNAQGNRQDFFKRLREARAQRRTARLQRKSQKVKPQVVVSRRGSGALPGVKSNSELFGINETKPTPGVQVAGVGSFGRLSPTGLRLQHSGVEVACFKPELLRVLKIVEQKYGQKPIVTSGYRSPKRNRRAGGASRSQHIYCKAADIQLDGVSKWDLAKFLRTIPGRGGVGTYCRTKSVHIDVGSKRDWHHPCRRSYARKKRRA